MAAKKVDILGIMDKIEGLYSQKKALAEEVKQYEKEINLLEKQLEVAIPTNGVKDGIQHILRERKTVAYSKALKEIEDKLLPKPKLPEAESIIESFTSVTYSHDFKRVE